MSISGDGKRLAMLTLQLITQWQQTKEFWKDAKGLEFERKFIDELKHTVDNSLTVIEQLDKLVTKARKDCE